MTLKFCGSKFKNGVDMAMGAKKQKTPTFKKLKFFAQKLRLTFEKNICVQKKLFSKKKIGEWSDLPPNFFRFSERPLEKNPF